MIIDGRKHFRRAVSAGAVVAIAAGSGTASTATGAVASVRAADSSSLRCHLELPVRVRAHRFVTSYDGAAIACAGVLVGRPVVAGSIPHASGTVKLVHLRPDLPPAFGKTRLRLEAVGPALPYDVPEHTRIELTLAPDPVSTHGAGHFTGSARIRTRLHHFAASIAFRPDPATQSAGGTGVLIVDLSAWAARA